MKNLVDQLHNNEQKTWHTYCGCSVATAGKGRPWFVESLPTVLWLVTELWAVGSGELLWLVVVPSAAMWLLCVTDEWRPSTDSVHYQHILNSNHNDNSLQPTSVILFWTNGKKNYNEKSEQELNMPQTELANYLTKFFQSPSKSSETIKGFHLRNFLGITWSFRE